MNASTPSPAPATPVTSGASMVRTLGVVATVCGLLIVSAYQGTLDAVTANKKIALERAVFKVIPGTASVGEFWATPGGVVPTGGAAPADGIKFLVAYDSAGQIKGIAAEGAGKGYADAVRILYAYDPAREAIAGIGVIAMRETPGIGDKINTDRAFLKNFEALDVRLAPDRSTLAHPVKTVKHGSKQNPWEIDAISGATITSKAVGKGINDSAGRLLPRLLPHLDKLEKR